MDRSIFNFWSSPFVVSRVIVKLNLQSMQTQIRLLLRSSLISVYTACSISSVQIYRRNLVTDDLLDIINIMTEHMVERYKENGKERKIRTIWIQNYCMVSYKWMSIMKVFRKMFVLHPFYLIISPVAFKNHILNTTFQNYG